MKKCVNQDCYLGKSGAGVFLDDDDYCSECGNKLAPKEDVKCQCGHRLGDKDKFCSGCGRSREEALGERKVFATDVKKLCLGCGTILDEETIFCLKCGYDQRKK